MAFIYRWQAKTQKSKNEMIFSHTRERCKTITCEKHNQSTVVWGVKTGHKLMRGMFEYTWEEARGSGVKGRG